MRDHNCEAVLIANKNLSNKITKLERERETLFRIKEQLEHTLEVNNELKRRLDIKRQVLRVIVQKDQQNYVLALTKVVDTPEGMFIEGIL